jgi:hypothetical protein
MTDNSYLAYLNAAGFTLVGGMVVPKNWRKHEKVE